MPPIVKTEAEFKTEITVPVYNYWFKVTVKSRPLISV